MECTASGRRTANPRGAPVLHGQQAPDSIVDDDISEFPDKNVAQSMRRVTCAA